MKVKFSILIPAYNVEDYIDACLESIFRQTYQNFEVIIIDDCSTDRTDKIIKKWIKEYPKKIGYFRHKKNKQVSISRNELIDAVSGDYFIFVDSDDRIASDLLYNINEIISEDKMPDLVHYGIRYVDHDGSEIDSDIKLIEFHNLCGSSAFSTLYRNYNTLESPCVYAFRTIYFKKNNFRFAEYRNHEDYGLIPLIILKSEKVSSLAFVGYYYIQKNDSIMRYYELEKDKKNAEDLLYHYDFLVENTKSFLDDNNLRHDLSFYLINALFYRAHILSVELKKWFILEIKRRKVYYLYYPTTFEEKVRGIVMRFSCRLYLYLYYCDKGIRCLRRR